MKLISLIFSLLVIISCSKQNIIGKNQTVIYQSENLIVTKISEHVYQHTSFLQTDDFGKVPCNGMVVVNENESAVFDTPADVISSKELIDFISNELNTEIKAVVATHFHDDCIGGLDEFHKIGVPSYANYKTIEFLNGNEKNIPQNGIDNEFILEVGNKKVMVSYFGEGHTKDNIVAYFPDEQILFGGCLIKEVGAGKGNLADANEKDWPATVRKIKEKYPEIKFVIPGHGNSGGMELLDYTIQLFQKN